MSQTDVVIDLTVYEADNETPLFGSASGGSITEPDFQTDSNLIAHPRPYLITPRGFTATEVDFIEGKSDIGAVSVGILDKRQEAADQNTGIVTSKIGEMVGRRATMRRWVPGISDYIILFEGVVSSYTVDTEDLVIYWLNLRDTREFERAGELFSSNYVLFGNDGLQGPAVNYGRTPAGETFDAIFDALFGDGDRFYMISKTGPFQSEAAAAEGEGVQPGDHFIRMDDGDPSDGIYWGFTPIGSVLRSGGRFHSYQQAPIFADYGYPTRDDEGTYRFQDVWVRWRPKGGSESDWVTLRDMPINRHENINTKQWLEFETPAGEELFTPGWIYFGAEDPADLPSTGEEIEFQVLAAEITPATPFFWDEGTLGDLLKQIQAGEHTDDPPSERYDSDALDEFAAETPRARFILKEPVTDRRKWIEEHIFKPSLYAPAMTTSLEVRPVSWELPENTEDVPLLDPDTIQPIGEWEESVGDIVKGIEFTYIREHLESREVALERKAKEGQGLSPASKYLQVADTSTIYDWERLRETEVVYKNEIENPPPGSKTLKYAPTTIRSISSFWTAVTGGDIEDEKPYRLAQRIFKTVTQKWVGGAIRYAVNVTATADNLQRAIGDWVRAKIDWMPDYFTGKRGTTRYMQLYAISDEDPAFRLFKMQDGGVPDPTQDEDIFDSSIENCLTGGEVAPAPNGGGQLVFDADGTLTNTCSDPITIDKLLLIAGGGAGGAPRSPGTAGAHVAGGGGAGGVCIFEDVVIQPGEAVPVRVGAGGSVGSFGDSEESRSGEHSVLWVDSSGFALDPSTDPLGSAKFARGGGGGGQADEQNGASGGSGGGGGAGGTISNDGSPGGEAVDEDCGNDGGDGFGLGGAGSCTRRGGGGGGGSYGGEGGDGNPEGSLQHRNGPGGPSTVLSEWGVTAGGGGEGGRAEETSCDVFDYDPGDSGDAGVGFGGGGAAGDVGGSPGGDGIVIVQYKGAPPGTLAVPTISSTGVDSRNRIRVTIDEDDWPVIEPDGYRVRIDYAVGSTEPAADSGEWQTAGYLNDAGTVATDAVPTGSTVWVRARAEAEDFRPSAYSTAIEVVTPSKPGLLRRELSYDNEADHVNLIWAENQFATSVTIRAQVHDSDGSPQPRPLPFVVTVDADFRLWTFTSLVPAQGERLTVDLEVTDGSTVVLYRISVDRQNNQIEEEAGVDEAIDAILYDDDFSVVVDDTGSILRSDH